MGTNGGGASAPSRAGGVAAPVPLDNPGLAPLADLPPARVGAALLAAAAVAAVGETWDQDGRPPQLQAETETPEEPMSGGAAISRAGSGQRLNHPAGVENLMNNQKPVLRPVDLVEAAKISPWPERIR